MTQSVIILLIVFGCVSIFHLISTLFKNPTARFISKPFCMTILGVATIIAIPNYPLVYIGVLLSLAGDIVILFSKKNKIFFGISILVFFGTHICYLSQILLSFPYHIEWYFYLIGVALCIITTIFSLHFVSKKIETKIAVPGTFYLVTIFYVIVCAIILCCSLQKVWPVLLIIIGYLLFFISDNCLVVFKFIIKIKHEHFYVMLTYLSAQILIVIGFILLLA